MVVCHSHYNPVMKRRITLTIVVLSATVVPVFGQGFYLVGGGRAAFSVCEQSRMERKRRSDDAGNPNKPRRSDTQGNPRN